MASKNWPISNCGPGRAKIKTKNQNQVSKGKSSQTISWFYRKNPSKEVIRELSKQIFSLFFSRSSQHSDPPEPPTNQEVSHAPNGLTKISKLRASKSMQNLEQITRDSLYNLKDISTNLKQKYNSRMELRQQSQMYNELWDDDADDVDEVDFYHRSYDY